MEKKDRPIFMCYMSDSAECCVFEECSVFKKCFPEGIKSEDFTLVEVIKEAK